MIDSPIKCLNTSPRPCRKLLFGRALGTKERRSGNSSFGHSCTQYMTEYIALQVKGHTVTIAQDIARIKKCVPWIYAWTVCSSHMPWGKAIKKETKTFHTLKAAHIKYYGKRNHRITSS